MFINSLVYEEVDCLNIFYMGKWIKSQRVFFVLMFELKKYVNVISNMTFSKLVNDWSVIPFV